MVDYPYLILIDYCSCGIHYPEEQPARRVWSSFNIVGENGFLYL